MGGAVSLNVAGVYDIECASWDRFVCGELLAVDGERFVSWSEADFYAELTSRTGAWYAHAGGTYDALWALDVACREGHPWSARLRGSGAMSVRLGELELRDSYALVPMSLAAAAPLGGKAKSTLGFACECGKACAGYCVLDRALTVEERAKVESYLHADCVATLAMLDALETRCERADVSLGLTVGGSAWKTARAWLAVPPATHDLGRYRRIREGYYGGRVEVYLPRAERGHRYDIHSSYPAALARTPLPTGEPRHLDTPADASRAFTDGLEGIYGARVRVPESHVPPLPVRTKDRLLYPHGPVDGAWTALELRHAMELGARVESVAWGYVWPTSAPVLAPFAERVWALRAAGEAESTPAGDVWAAWCKWLANSLTGKCAQRPEHGALQYTAADDAEAPALETDGWTEIVRPASGGMFWKRTTSRVDPCAHVEWSAYLTAEARCELHRQQLHAGAALIYSDTDSVYAGRELDRRVGPALGEWGSEGALSDFAALAPKVYRFRCASCKKHPTGGDHVRGKGMSGLTSAGFDGLARGEQWHVAAGVAGIRTALGRPDGGLFTRKALARGLLPVPGWIGGRELARGGATRATTIARYDAAADLRRAVKREARGER